MLFGTKQIQIYANDFYGLFKYFSCLKNLTKYIEFRYENLTLYVSMPALLNRKELQCLRIQ